MNEIEKMYENAGIKPKRGKEITIDPITDKENYHNVCYSYPPFTAEKQLELIKRFIPAYPLNFTYGFLQTYSFDKGLAYRMNSIWEKFTPKDKQQIKEILE